MPSYPIHLAIAKKYLETHKEENEEEFYQGTIAPDNKPILELGNGRLHYGKNSHKPDLNRYYHEEGLDSSYNRGYFLHLLTDYLFYNRFLTEYSHDIYDDYRKMNKRIIDKYDLQIPENIKRKVKIVDGDLKAIDENEIYKFIETVGGLDLEEYKSQIKETDSEHQIKLVGLKEGLLYKHNEPNYFNSHDEEYFYGFENNYGVLIRRKIGFAETEGAPKGLYEVTPCGIATKPSQMMKFEGTDISQITEDLSDETMQKILMLCEKNIGKSISIDATFHFECVSKEDIKTILKLIKQLPRRKPEKKITERGLNSDLIKQEDIEIV